MRKQRRWICGQMGELVSVPRCRISSDFDFIKETLWGFLWIWDNQVRAGDNRNNGISDHWKSKCIHMEGSKEPVCAMWYKGLKRITSSFEMYVGGLEREDLDCHLVSISPTTPSSDLKPPELKQSSLWVLLNENICPPRRAAWITSSAASLC